MRRTGLVVFVLALAGCSVLRDAFTAHATVAAEAAGQVLTVERLAEIASRVKGMPLQQQNLLRLAGGWVDYTLFVTALARGDSLRDSALVAQTLWPRVAQARFEHFISAQSEGRAKLNPAQVDSAFQAGDQRLFQHILIQVPPNSPPPVVQQKEAAAKRVWQEASAGGGRNFAVLAKRYSDDGSKTNGGFLGIHGRGFFVAQFEDAAWQLAPGSISAVVRSPFGFHIVRRPPLAEVRDSFALGVTEILKDRYDSTFFARLQQERKIQLAGRAAATAREAVQDLDRARISDDVIASYTGGDFRVRDFARWMLSVDPRMVQTLPNASDQQIDDLLLTQLVPRHIAVTQAESAGVRLDPDEWAGLRADYDSALTMLEGFLKVSPQILRDSATTPAGRERLAMTRVDEFFDRAVSGQAPFVPVPPFLAQALRQRGAYSFDQPGVRRAVERAGELRGSADSLQGPRARPGLRPSPVPPIPPGAKQVGPTKRVLE